MGSLPPLFGTLQMYFEAYLLSYNALSTAQLGARGRGWFHFATTIHEQAQSNRACIAFMCDVCLAFSMDSYLLYYIFTTALPVQCGGRKKSPRARNQCCYLLPIHRDR